MVLPVTPSYVDGTTQIDLALPAILTEGLYQLTATSGEPGLRDLDGKPFDHNQDGFGDDFVGTFEIDFTAPVVLAVDPGTCLTFDGANDTVYVGNDPSLRLAGDITVEAWVRTGNPTATMVVVDKYDGNYDLGWALYLDQGKATFGGRDGTGQFRYAGLSDVIVADGQWHHLAGQREGSVWRIFVDGRLAAETDKTVAAIQAAERAGAGARRAGIPESAESTQ